jgi:NAD(P)H-hydrate repair Nnr-like enzyme with NAD(P)H-hydrate dehydratase domain
MQPDYLYRQQTDKPLFPDMLWSRPENRLHAGKLLIVGGNAHGFAAVAKAYNASVKAGIGSSRVILPDAIQKIVGPVMPEGEFAPSTPSGSFGQKALAEVLAMTGWADGVLVAGDVGRNSETAILLEKFATKYHGQLTLTKDAADYFTNIPVAIKNRPKTCLVISFSQLQRLAVRLMFPHAFTIDMGFYQITEALHMFTKQFPLAVVTKHLETIFAATDGKVSTTKLIDDKPIWRVTTAAYVSVWWLQNSNRSFEAMTTAILDSI